MPAGPLLFSLAPTPCHVSHLDDEHTYTLQCSVCLSCTRCQSPDVPSAGSLLKHNSLSSALHSAQQSTLPTFTPWPTPGDFVVSQRLLRLACSQVTRQRHHSPLHVKDSPVNSSERNNHLPGPSFQTKTVSKSIQ